MCSPRHSAASTIEVHIHSSRSRARRSFHERDFLINGIGEHSEGTATTGVILEFDTAPTRRKLVDFGGLHCG